MINILHFISFSILIPLWCLTIMISCTETLTEPEEEIAKATPLVPQGISKFQFNNYPTLSNAPLTVHTYLADSSIKNIPIVFIMHGASRNGYDYCIDWVEPARKHNFLIVCPEIDVNRYPGSAGYNLGGMYDGSTLLDSTQWTFSFIEPIFQFLIENEVSTVETYGIYGHSAGSQFVHRFALFTHPTHAKIFIAANAGWYTMTDFTEAFPYGFQNSPMTEENIKEKFKLDLVILLGENDTDPNASSLRKTEEAMRQGKHRF